MLPLPLFLLRVLDLSSSVAGGYATRVLADFGAEVIKLEPPEGSGRELQADFYASLHRNKLSLSIDFDKPRGRELLFRLVNVSKIVVVDDGGSGSERLSIDSESVLSTNPGASFISVDSQGSADVGIAAAGAALASLFHHRATGEGQNVDIHAASVEANLLGHRVVESTEGRPSEPRGLESLNVNAIVTEPRLLAKGFFEPVSSSDGEVRLTDGSPYRFSRSPARVRLPAPSLGEHNEYVLGEVLGLSTDEIKALGSI